VKRFIALIKEAAAAWSRNRAPRMAAAIAYYAIFALPPLLMLTIMVASLVFERAAARQQLLAVASDLVGRQATQTLDQFLDNVPTPAGDWLSTIVGLGGLLFSASGIFSQLQDSLNVLWGVHTASQGVKQMVLTRASHIIMVALVGVLFIVMIISATMASWLVDLLPPPIGGNSLIAQIVDIFVSLLFVALAFGLVYKVVPNVKIASLYAFLGALVTSVLFLIGRFALRLFFRYSDPASAYGAAGSIILLLLWIYYLAQIFFFGAEVTKVLTEWQGGAIKPEPGMLREASVMHPPGDLAEADVEGSPELREAIESVTETRRRNRDVPRRPEGLLGRILGTLSVMLLLLAMLKFGKRDNRPEPGGLPRR
jgi:membrane protein